VKATEHQSESGIHMHQEHRAMFYEELSINQAFTFSKNVRLGAESN